jgi:alpha-beta hydrolase superfamily lysophospholipase
MRAPVVILHGYSDNSSSFEPLARFLKDKGFVVVPIFLGNYITLEDTITVPDLTKAFEAALHQESLPVDEPGGIDLVVHSTGSLVAREWMTRFYLEAGRPCPVRRYLMLAPANFGSPAGTANS